MSAGAEVRPTEVCLGAPFARTPLRAGRRPTRLGPASASESPLARVTRLPARPIPKETAPAGECPRPQSRVRMPVRASPLQMQCPLGPIVVRMVHDTTFIKHGKAWVDCLKAAEAEPRPGLGAYHGHGRSEHLPPPTVGIRVLKPFPDPRPSHHRCESQAADDHQHGKPARHFPGGPHATP